MGYEIDIFYSFDYDFKVSKKFKSSAKRISLLLNYSLLLITFKNRPKGLAKSEE